MSAILKLQICREAISLSQTKHKNKLILLIRLPRRKIKILFILLISRLKHRAVIKNRKMRKIIQIKLKLKLKLRLNHKKIRMKPMLSRCYLLSIKLLPQKKQIIRLMLLMQIFLHKLRKIRLIQKPEVLQDLQTLLMRLLKQKLKLMFNYNQKLLRLSIMLQLFLQNNPHLLMLIQHQQPVLPIQMLRQKPQQLLQQQELQKQQKIPKHLLKQKIL